MENASFLGMLAKGEGAFLAASGELPVGYPLPSRQPVVTPCSGPFPSQARHLPLTPEPSPLSAWVLVAAPLPKASSGLQNGPRLITPDQRDGPSRDTWAG